MMKKFLSQVQQKSSQNVLSSLTTTTNSIGKDGNTTTKSRSNSTDNNQKLFVRRETTASTTGSASDDDEYDVDDVDGNDFDDDKDTDALIVGFPEMPRRRFLCEGGGSNSVNAVESEDEAIVMMSEKMASMTTRTITSATVLMKGGKENAATRTFKNNYFPTSSHLLTKSCSRSPISNRINDRDTSKPTKLRPILKLPAPPQSNKPIKPLKSSTCDYSNYTKRKSVTFSPSSTLHQWSRNDKDNYDEFGQKKYSSWYNKFEYKMFRRNVRLEVSLERQRSVVASELGMSVDEDESEYDSDNNDNQDNIILDQETILSLRRGIEHLLCPKTLTQIMKCRDLHKKIVLEKQFHVWNESELRNASKRVSKWAKARAWTHANADVLEDRNHPTRVVNSGVGSGGRNSRRKSNCYNGVVGDENSNGDDGAVDKMMGGRFQPMSLRDCTNTNSTARTA